MIQRRRFLQSSLAGALGFLATSSSVRAAPAWRPRYVLGSCLYGTTDLAEILPEVSKVDAQCIDIWPRVHGNQREQIDAMGCERCAELLAKYRVKLGVLTRYDLGPFGLSPEIEFAKTFDTPLIVTAGAGPKNLTGKELKSAIGSFVTRLEPQLALADKQGVTIGIENHGNNLIDSPDALRWLAELAAKRPLGIALAPYHLPQDPELLANLIRDLGPRLVHFYAWQHGKGALRQQPKADELLQLPGQGPLDFAPVLAALAQIRYPHLVEIFMHPFPRGIAILETTAEVTDAVNRARAYLESRLPTL